MFYETPGRSAVSRFTASFMSDVGLGMLVMTEKPTLWETSTKIFSSFTPWLWCVSFLVAVLVSVCFWIVEASEHDTQRPPANGESGGYLTLAGARRHWPGSLSHAFLTLFNMSVLGTHTKRGDVLNVVWCLFAVIWLAAYEPGPRRGRFPCHLLNSWRVVWATDQYECVTRDTHPLSSRETVEER